MKIKEELDRLIQEATTSKKLNTKQLAFLAENNDISNLIELTHAFVRIVKGYDDKQPEKIRSFADIVTGEKEQIAPLSHPESLLELFNEDDCIVLLNTLFILKEKLSSTLYEWIIKDTAREFLLRIKQLKCYETTRKDLLNEMTKSFLEEDYLNPEKEQSMRAMLKSGLDNLDTLMSQFESLTEIYNFFHVKILPMLIAELQHVKPKEKYNLLKRSLALIGRFFFPLELEVHMEKNSLSESRRFRPIIEREFLHSYIRIIKPLGKLFNEIILCPSYSQLQTQLFLILRRMYYLWGEQVRNPLFTVLLNLSLFCEKEQDLKHAAIFCYKIVSEKTDVELSNLIQNSEHLKFIRQSPYFSSKAYAYMNDSSPEVPTTDINLPFFKLRRTVESGELWHYNIICEKSSSLLVWEFELSNHDIGFGLYRIDNMASLQLEDYEKQRNCKAVLKLAKHASSKTAYKGWMLLKSGLYRFVFDNTYSFLRSKEILYSMHLLEQI